MSNDNGAAPDEKLTNRLAELKNELEIGQDLLAKKQAELSKLQQMLLRISGAIQILEELSEVAETESIDG